MTDTTDVTAVTITRLSPNTSYSIKVRAVNAIGNGAWSEPVMTTTTSQGWCIQIKDMHWTDLTKVGITNNFSIIISIIFPFCR